MSGVAMSVKPIGFTRARIVLNKLSYLNARELLDNIGAVIESQVRRRIEAQEGPPQGGNWPELSAAYAARKRKISDGGFLQLRGHLHDSLTHNVFGSDSVEIGSNLEYAATQQLGSEDGTTPAREYLGLSAENEDEVEQAISDWLRMELGL